jgi:hypothetical protein
VIVSAVGSAVGAAAFFVVLEWALGEQAWAIAMLCGVAFGVFMAAWLALMIRLDGRQHTARNELFEHSVAAIIAVLAVAWIMVAPLDHLRWQHLMTTTLLTVPFLVLLRFVTRRHIKGEDPRDLFA